MTLLSSEQILKLRPRTDVAETPAGNIKVTGMNACEVINFNETCNEETPINEFYARIVRFCVKDEQENYVFPTLEDVLKLPLNVLEPIAQKAMKVSGMGGEAQKEIEKN